MRRLATALVLALVGPELALSASPGCLATVADVVASCLADGATAKAVTRLERKVLARCPAAAIRDAGFPPPFDPAQLAHRLVRDCSANADALRTRTADALGAGGTRACGTTLDAVSARLAARIFATGSACMVAGDACDAGRTAKRIAAVEAKARRKARRRCPERGLAGLLARVRTQASCALGGALPAAPPCAPAGVEALADLWRLASPRSAGARVAQVSSYDRTGGNADLGIGPDTAPLLAILGLPSVELDHSYLYRDGDRYVVFDERGPGVVWRIWMTGLDGLLDRGLHGDIAFELDGEAVARATLPRATLFAGGTAPFLTPLAGDAAVSSGGYYSVLPIAFARRLRITTSTVPNWLHVTFAKLPPDQAVASFDPSADVPAVAAVLASAGDPATTRVPGASDEVALAVAPGASATSWSYAGRGTIVRLELLAPAGTPIATGLRLRATFDDAATPQVDAPLDDFFGASLGAGARSLAFGQDGDRYYSYFPMPFTRAARIEVANGGATPFERWRLRVGYVETLPPGRPAYFHATPASAHLEPDGRDYVLLDAAGTGHVVGVVMTAGCAGVGQCQLANLPGADGAHLEGDERITVDGSRWPSVHGTGLEDFFSGGFYFVRGAFRLPTHGNPAQVAGTSPRRPGLNLRSVYRLFLGDAIPYENGIRLAIEHGPTDDVAAEFSSLVFHYAVGGAALVESDRVSIGDAASEAGHVLASEGRTDTVLTSAFRGNDSDLAVTAAGMSASATRFRVRVDPENRGVRLRRLADLAGGAQTARVTVNGAFAGVWQSSEVNGTLRWAEVELEIPAGLTAGQSTLDVELDARASPTPWTAYEYVVLSRRP
jgi:hypothetical protein